jgi:apolipoprotein N-acyltransferase
MSTAMLSPLASARPTRMRRQKRLRAKRPSRSGAAALVMCLTLAAGALHAAGWLFPGAWLPVWAGQAALIALGVSTTPRRALVFGTLAGAIGIASSFYWGVAALRQTFDASPAIAWSVFALLVVMESLGFGVLCFAASRASHGGVPWMWIVPCVWVAIEQWFPRVFPWRMGYSQLEVLPLVQIADLVGSTGIGFVITALAAAPSALYLGFWRPQATRADCHGAICYSSAAMLLLVCTLVYGGVRISQWERWCADQPKLKVALVQVDPAYVGSEQKLRERSAAVHDQVDLLCWPESAAGVYAESLTHFRNPDDTMRLSRHSLRSLEPAKDFSCHLLAGGKLYREGADEAGPYSMTAFLIGPQQDILGRYRKRTLLPFGEYIPGQQWFPKVREWATLHEIFEAGKDSTPLITASGRRLGVVICYEDTLPRNVRLAVAEGAEALFSLIQGTAFDNPLTLVQHQRLAVLRAVENRRYFVRCASTGVTCVVSPTGRIVDQLPPQEEGTLQSEIALVQSRTLYSRMGDLFPIVCTILAGLGLWSAGRRSIAGP